MLNISEETVERVQPPTRWVALVRLIDAWLRRRRTLAALDRLSDRELRDVGLERTWDGYEVEPGSTVDWQTRAEE